VEQALESGLVQLASLGAWGPVLLTLLFSLYVACGLPSTPVELASGFLYGPVIGAAIGTAAKTSGSTFAYWVGRIVGKRMGWKVPPQLEPYLGQLRVHPTVTMIMIRVAPLPLVVKNLGLAIAEVPAMPYFVAALAVNAPFSVMWAMIGASCKSLKEALSGDKAQDSDSTMTPIIVTVAAGLLLLGGMRLQKVLRSKRPPPSMERLSPARSPAMSEGPKKTSTKRSRSPKSK
jgi:uncharacterized membrane protein YdjX (TVP38/TMEM64 family)